jgi:lambda family phage minor tail protein L
MYILNASLTWQDYLYYTNYNQNIYGYALDSSGNLTATEVLYTGFPITRDAVTSDTSGEISEIKIGIPNTDRIIESVIQTNNYLRGCSVNFVFAFASNLPSGATPNHIGTAPDKNAVVTEKLYIDSTSSSEEVVMFSCKPKFIIKNIILPGRRHTIECSWGYLSNECDPYNLINTASYLTCKKNLEQCEERGNKSRYGGFPAIPKKGIYIVS